MYKEDQGSSLIEALLSVFSYSQLKKNLVFTYVFTFFINKNKLP